MTEIERTLEARGSVYGPFDRNAMVSQRLKEVISDMTTSQLEDRHREALDMICFKISRIITGDPTYRDNWVDIAGYAMLAIEKPSA